LPCFNKAFEGCGFGGSNEICQDRVLDRWTLGPTTHIALISRVQLPESRIATPNVRRKEILACPFFFPTHKADDIAWLHPSRLPLGAGWRGHCDAPGHEGFAPTSEEIMEHCNLGYAAACSRLPEKRDCDAVRFSVQRHSESELVLWFVFELRHRPAGHGTLEYKVTTRQWILPHPNERIQKMAECYVQSYLSRRVPAELDLGISHCDPNITETSN